MQQRMLNSYINYRWSDQHPSPSHEVQSVPFEGPIVVLPVPSQKAHSFVQVLQLCTIGNNAINKENNNTLLINNSFHKYTLFIK
jgi:hypothetical protein